MVINKIDSTDDVSTNLAPMEPDIERMRGGRPYVFTNLKTGAGLNRVAAFIEAAGGLRAGAPQRSSAE